MKSPTLGDWAKLLSPIPPSSMLPLLSKELVEQAARRRTYIVRVVYAILLFLAGFMFYYQIVGRYSDGSSPFALLGQGGELFISIVMLQFFGIYLFMPAMTCSVITVEKERGSLSLLLLTKLGGWTIILEKYLGRIIPMFSFLLLSVPLLVIAYSMGGVSKESIGSGIWFLSLTTLQVGALALACSTFFRTTVGSFMATFVLGIVMLIWLPMLAMTMGWHRSAVDEWFIFMFVTPVLFIESSNQGGTGWAFAWHVALQSTPILIQTLVFLVLARVFLIRRAFLPPTNLFLKILKWFDEFFHWANDNRWTKGKVLISDKVELDTIIDPVAWRETTKTSLGSFRYLMRLFILIEAPILFLGLLLISIDGSPEPLTFLAFLLWIVSTLIVAVKATTLVSGERAHETLDVLLTTPMRSSEILMQKFRGVTRLMIVLSIPLLTTVFLKAAILQTGTGGYRGWNSYGYNYSSWPLYLLCGIVTVCLYLPMVAWLSLFIGIRVRNQSKAIFATMAALVGWCALPVFLIVLLFEMSGGWNGRSLGNLWLLLSPATIITNNEVLQLENMFDSGWLAFMINFLLYGLITVLLRMFCLSDLDSRLGRSSGEYA